MQHNLYRNIPKMDKLLEQESMAALIKSCGREKVVLALREALESIRDSIAQNSTDPFDIQERLSNLESYVTDILTKHHTKTLRRVINATGIILHTNLGRAPLAKEAVEAAVEAASGYVDLEYDLETGKRGGRLDCVNSLICELTGAQDSYVVNNNAAAVLITLAALANGKEVIISRGELVEIGGGFRIPEVLEQSGAKLKEVGTTNKTRVKDYEKAIDENTCAILKVHKSNYRIVGFTEEISVEELVALSHKHNILTIEDLGSGMFVKGFGEPTVQEVIASGVDIVTFSGDKLLGGPQAGIIAGKEHIIAKIRTHPLARALRIDKMTLAALESTLTLYTQPDTFERIPVIRMLNMNREELFKISYELAGEINNINGLDAKVIEVSSQAGGGSLPGKEFHGFAVAIKPSCGCNNFLKALREARIPVIARISQDSVLIDLRTMLNDDYKDLLKSLREAAEAL